MNHALYLKSTKLNWQFFVFDNIVKCPIQDNPLGANVQEGN